MKHNQNGIWKKVPTYRDYEVSNTGLLRSHKAGGPRILKGTQRYRKEGERFIHQHSLYKGSRQDQETFTRHELILWTFTGRRTSPVEFVNFKNGDSLDCRLINLERRYRQDMGFTQEYDRSMLYDPYAYATKLLEDECSKFNLDPVKMIGWLGENAREILEIYLIALKLKHV